MSSTQLQDRQDQPRNFQKSWELAENVGLVVMGPMLYLLTWRTLGFFAVAYALQTKPGRRLRSKVTSLARRGLSTAGSYLGLTSGGSTSVRRELYELYDALPDETTRDRVRAVVSKAEIEADLAREVTLRGLARSVWVTRRRADRMRIACWVAILANAAIWVVSNI